MAKKSLTKLVLPNFDIFADTDEAVMWRRKNCCKSDDVKEILEYCEPVIERLYGKIGISKKTPVKTQVRKLNEHMYIQIFGPKTPKQELHVAQYSFLIRNGFVGSYN